MDARSESRLAEVHPILAKRIHDLVDMLSFPIVVTQGYRTYPQQHSLYMQGRSLPGAIITNADAGHSMHNFGLAVDVAPTDGFKIDWDGKDEKWAELLAKALTCKLSEGAKWRTFPDEPHLYPVECPANPDDDMRYILNEGGLQAVWDSFKLIY